MTAAAEMACRELVAVITAYLEETLGPADRARFLAHLALCPGCEAYLEQMRLTIQLAGTLREQDLPEAGREKLLAAFRDWAGRSRR
jgi:anti-sigma factor RsiW